MERPGAPDVLRVVEREAADPRLGEVLVRQTVLGVNYIDVQHRTGRYPLPEYPAAIGMEACGVVERTGPGVTGVVVGDRVAYACPPVGAYTELRCMAADRLVKVPGGVEDYVAGANLLRGLTAQYLLKGTRLIKPGDHVLVHAAAGGVGLILCQWAKHLGATVLGTVGSEAKAAAAREHGCDHPILYTKDDFAARVREVTDGAGVDVVYDSVGGPTFERSLASLKPRGMLASYGTAGGPIPPFDISRLNALGSLFVTSPSIFTYTKARAELVERAADFFACVLSGVVRIAPGHRFPLEEATRAHEALQARATTGAVALIP
jgi:NADPH2:quinone reductase